MKISSTSKVYELEDLWKQRQQALTQEERSLQEYQTLDPEQRDAVEDIVDQALVKMRADKSWLPHSLKIEEGLAVDVSLRILFSDISDEIVKRRDQERKQIAEAMKSTTKMVTEMETPSPASNFSESCERGDHQNCHISGMNSFRDIVEHDSCNCDCHQP